MTERHNTYNTRPRRAILDYLATLDGAHFTADELGRHFSSGDMRIGLTTIYRHLNRLEEEGVLRRFSTGNQTATCYQYIVQPERCAQHFHLRCDACGELFHLDCAELSEIASHIAADHAFHLDAANTIFRGTCATCDNSK
jgi:Fur family ferric uptake transcriptional regulator